MSLWLCLFFSSGRRGWGRGGSCHRPELARLVSAFRLQFGVCPGHSLWPTLSVREVPGGPAHHPPEYSRRLREAGYADYSTVLTLFRHEP